MSVRVCELTSLNRMLPTTFPSAQRQPSNTLPSSSRWRVAVREQPRIYGCNSRALRQEKVSQLLCAVLIPPFVVQALVSLLLFVLLLIAQKAEKETGWRADFNLAFASRLC